MQLYKNAQTLGHFFEPLYIDSHVSLVSPVTRTPSIAKETPSKCLTVTVCLKPVVSITEVRRLESYLKSLVSSLLSLVSSHLHSPSNSYSALHHGICICITRNECSSKS